jgi:Zn-dependent protease with chaperone function/tellurite resistance protein
VPRGDLRAEGDRELAERLLAELDVQTAIERLGTDPGARRQLLATATRLTREMAPDIHDMLDECRQVLGVETPLEIYVYPESMFNAAAVRPEHGRLFLLFSSALLEAFEPDELRFVAGHELGHYLFEHHRIPVAVLLSGRAQIDAALALRLFAWQRYAEISADRTGVVAARGLDPAARALFKLASGLRGDRVKVRIDQFLSQVGDLRQEAERLATADDPPRSDFFATHPFSPLRLKAVELFAASELVQSEGLPRADLEMQVQELMALMEPSYLQDRSDVAEAMRRLLFAGGVAVATASGPVSAAAIKVLERLLGVGSIPSTLKPDVIRADLPSRIDAVNRIVPPLRRAQVIRDLCVIARADGRIDAAKLTVIREIGKAVHVDETLIMSSTLPAPTGSCSTCAEGLPRVPSSHDPAAPSGNDGLTGVNRA